MKYSYIETRSHRVNKSFIILLLPALLTINRLAKSLFRTTNTLAYFAAASVMKFYNIVTLWLGGGCAKATEAKARPKMRTDDFGNIFEDQPTWEQSYETFYGRQSGIS